MSDNESNTEPASPSQTSMAPEVDSSLAEFMAKQAEVEKRGQFYFSLARWNRQHDDKPGDDRARAAFLWDLLDDISTLGDAAKDDDAGYRAAVEKVLALRGQAGIVTDGYRLFFPGDEGYEAAAKPPTGCEAVAANIPPDPDGPDGGAT